jgi:NitT/TauT family transport system substrate-binding protein
MKTIVMALLAGALALALSAPAGAASALRLGYLQNDVHQLACWVALEEGLYKAEGLQVEVAGIFKAGPELMSAFAARALDVGYVGAAPTVTAAANQGVQVTILAQVNGEGSSLVCGHESAMHNVADLKGRTVAVPGHATVQDFLLRRALAQAKLEPEAVNIMVVKPPEMIGALRMGQLDAFVAWEPYPARAIEQAVGRALATSHDIWPGHPCCVLALSGQLADQRPEVAKSLVRAHRAATQFIKEHPQRAADIAVANTGMDLPTVRRAMAGVTYDTHLSAAHLREYVEHLARMGYIKVADTDAFLARLLRGRMLVGE